MKPKGRRVFFRALALLLSVAFVLPELAWTFDWHNLQPLGKNGYLDIEVKKDLAKIIAAVAPENAQAPCIVHIEDLHTNVEAQDHIRQLITQFVEQNHVRLVAMEGSAGFLDAGRLRPLPYPETQQRLFRHFMQNGQLSGTEAAALAAPTGLVLYGAEDAETYERSLKIVKGFLGRSVQAQFQNVLYLQEELTGAVDTEELAALDEKADAFQAQKISLDAYLAFLRKTAATQGVNLAEYPEVAALAGAAETDLHEADQKTQRLRAVLRAKLYTRPALQAAVDRWREDLDRMDRIFNLAAYPEDLAYARGQGVRFGIKAFLDFYRDQAPALGLTVAADPNLYALDAHLQEALAFYGLAEQRSRALVENTLRAMKTYHAARAVLVAGGFHTRGIDAELDARHVARLTLRPAIRTWQDSPQYYRQLTGELGPFRALFTPAARHFLALPSVFELRPEHQDFWQAFGALYFAQIAPALGKGKTTEAFRQEMESLAATFNQNAPYAVRVDWAACDVSALDRALPLILEAQGRSLRVTATPHAWPVPGVQAFYTYGQGGAKVALYPAALTPAIAAALRPRTAWQRGAAALELGALSFDFLATALPVVLGLAVAAVVVVVLATSAGWLAAASLGAVAGLAVGVLVRGWQNRTRILAESAPLVVPEAGALPTASIEAEPWEVLVDEHERTGMLTPQDLVQVMLAVAENPQRAARWSPWLQRVAGGGYQANALVQRLAQKFLASYSVRTLAGAGPGVGSEVLQVTLGSTPQVAEAILRLYGLAAATAARDPLPEGFGPASRITSIQAIMGAAVARLWEQNLLTGEADPVMEATWDALVRSLDSDLHRGLAYDAQHGYAQYVHRLQSQNLSEQGLFELGLPGWVRARQLEEARAAVRAKTALFSRANAQGRVWTAEERGQWLEEFSRQAWGAPGTEEAALGLWAALQDADVSTRLELAQRAGERNRLQGLRQFVRFGLPLADLKARAEELDHDAVNFVNASIGLTGLASIQLGQVRQTEAVVALRQALDEHSEVIGTAMQNIRAVTHDFARAEALASGTVSGLDTGELEREKQANLNELNAYLAGQHFSPSESQMLLRGFYADAGLRRNLEQALLFRSFMTLRERTLAVLPLLEIAVQRLAAEAGAASEPAVVARLAYLYARLLADLMDTPTFCENSPTRQTLDLRLLYAVCREMPELLTRGLALDDIALSVEAEPGFLESSQRVRGDYGRSLISVVANSVVNASYELKEKKAGLGEAGAGFQGRIKVTFGAQRVSVEDNGRGVPVEKLGELTRRGFTSRPEAGGRGLGMNVAANTINEFGGRLAVANKTGEETGARFTYAFEAPAGGQAAAPAAWETFIRDIVGDPVLKNQLAGEQPAAAELAAGERGQAASVASAAVSALPLEAIPGLLRSGSPREKIRALAAIETRAGEMDTRQLAEAALALMWINALSVRQPRIARAAWRTLAAVKDRLTPDLRARAEAVLEKFRQNTELVIKTYAYRLQGVYTVMRQHPGIMQLLARPGGVVVNDIGLGGPLPLTTAELTRFVKTANPDNRVVGADILVPAFRTLDKTSGLFAYHNTQGEVVGVYNPEGVPLSAAEAAPQQARFTEAFAAYRARGEAPADVEITADPLQAYARENGFEIQTASYGLGIPAGVKVCFNVMYMNAGQEEGIITRMGRDLETGGYLLNGATGLLGQTEYVNFVLYQKQSDGSMRPVSLHFVLPSVAYASPLPAGQTGIQDAEELSAEQYLMYQGDVRQQAARAGANGLRPEDVTITHELIGDDGVATGQFVRVTLAELLAAEGPEQTQQNLRVSAPRAFLAALLSVLLGGVFSLTLSPAAALITVSVWGAVSGLGLALNYLPRIYYALRLLRPRAPRLTPEQAGVQLADLIADVERRGGLPAGYRRPRLEVLPAQSLGALLGRGLLVGQGHNGVVRLHTNFLSLPRAAQRAVLQHEIFEALGRGHARATVREIFSLLGSLAAALAQGPRGRGTRISDEGDLAEVETRVLEPETAVTETELLAGERGEVAVIASAPGRAAPMEGIPFLLHSRRVQDTLRGFLTIEMRVKEMNADQLEETLKSLLKLNLAPNKRVARLAWQTLQMVKPFLSPEGQARAEASLQANRKNGQLVMTTSSQRLKDVYDFMLNHPGLRALLTRPGGAVINDIGLGGPVPVTTAELTERMREVNPENRVVGADILLPAFRSWDRKHNLFAYHNAAGVVVGIYGLDGRPLPEADAGPYAARLQAAVQDHLAGKTPSPEVEVTADPVQTYAREKGFTVQRASYGAGIRAAVKVCFNVLYLNPGREAVVIARMGRDLEPGGYLLNGLAAAQDRQPYTSFVLYQKQADGTMLPLSLHLILEADEYEFPLKPGYQSIEAAENLAQEDMRWDNYNRLMFDDQMLARYGLTRGDVKITTMLRSRNSSLVVPGAANARRGNLRVSPWKILGTFAAALSLGVLWTIAFPHGSWLIPAGWGLFTGVLLAVNFVPRLFYLNRLLNPTAPELRPEMANDQIAPLLQELERSNLMPVAYERPQVIVLPVQSFLSKLFYGIIVGQGQVNTIYLHRNFLSLPPTSQRAVLMHEITEAHYANHFLATYAEYRQLFSGLRQSLSQSRTAVPATPAAPPRSRIVFFTPGRVEGEAAQIANLGAKGRNLAIMATQGMPVPPGFTVEDDVSLEVNQTRRFTGEMIQDVTTNLEKLERAANQRFGDVENPLLVSTRSGAEYSLPGMMITITHVGLNDRTVEALARKTGRPYLVWSWYVRLIAAYGQHALGLPASDFDRITREYLQAAGKHEARVPELQALVKLYKEYLLEKRGEPFPQDLKLQLLRCMRAVMASWEDPRVKDYRLMYGIPDVGTGVTVQKMAFGDLDDDSGSGVAYSRDPETGESLSQDGQRAVFGEYVAREAGEAVVSGSQTGVNLTDMATRFPRVYAQLVALAQTLETHFHALQDIEFTFESGKLFLLQTRNAGKMIYPRALVRSMQDLVAEGLLSGEEVLERVSLEDLDWASDSLKAPKIASNAPSPLAVGIPAAPGIAAGVVVFTEVQAKLLMDQGKRVVLVKNRAEREDEFIINSPKCAGVVDLVGGRLSHAASLLRTQRNLRPCVVGLEHAFIFEAGDAQNPVPYMVINGQRIHLGDAVTLDGNRGGLYLGDDIPQTPSDVGAILAGAESRKESSADWKLYQQIQQWKEQYQARVTRENQALEEAVRYWVNTSTPGPQESPVNKVLAHIQSVEPSLIREEYMPELVLLASLLLYPKRDLENSKFMSAFSRAYDAVKDVAGEELARHAGGQMLAVLLEANPAILQHLLHLGGIHGTLTDMLAGLEARPAVFLRILESMQVDITRFGNEQFRQVYVPKTNFIFTRGLKKWSAVNLQALLVQLKPETLVYLMAEWMLGLSFPGLNRLYYGTFTQEQLLNTLRRVLAVWQAQRPEAYTAFWKKVESLDTTQQTEIFRELSDNAVKTKRAPVPVYAQNWVKEMLAAAGIRQEGALRVALGRMLANALGVLLVTLLLAKGLPAAWGAVLAVVWGSVGALGLLANYLPRIYYALRLARGGAEALDPEALGAQLAGVFAEVERRGGLPEGYLRPVLEVLPPQSRLSALLGGMLVGQGVQDAEGRAVVRLHPNFLSLPENAQAAVLRHEIFEAFGRGHARATLEEFRTYLTAPYAPGTPVAYTADTSVTPRDLALIRRAQAQGGLLDAAAISALPASARDQARLAGGVKLHLIGQGAFKRTYAAELQVRLASGQETRVTVAVKVPRSFLSTLAGHEARNWQRLKGHPNVVSFLHARAGVLAEEFVEAKPATAADSRRAAATYLSLLAHLWQRQGEHWFFFDPKVENILFPRNEQAPPKVVDLDGVERTPVRFEAFTVLVYLTAFYGSAPLPLTRLANGLLAPVMLFFSVVFAYFVNPGRAVFDAVLDAFGYETGRRYLEAAQHNWQATLAAPSALARALDDYLNRGIRTYQPSLPGGTPQGLEPDRALVWRGGQLELNTTDPAWLEAWQRFQAEAAAPVLQALTEQVQGGGTVRFADQPGDVLLQRAGSEWTLDPRLLLGQQRNPALAPAPWSVWTLVLGLASTPTRGRAWAFAGVFSEAAARYGLPALVAAQAWLGALPRPAGAGLWRARLGLTGVWDVFRGLGGSVRASETSVWLRLQLLRPVFAAPAPQVREIELPRELVQALRSRLVLLIRAHWAARQAVQAFLALPAAQRENFKFSTDDEDLLAAMKAEVVQSAERGDNGARQLNDHLQTVLLAEGRPADLAHGAGLMLLTRASAARASWAAWAEQLTAGRVFFCGWEAGETARTFAPGEAVDFAMLQKALAGQGGLAVGQQSEVLSTGLGETAEEEDRLAQAAEDEAAVAPDLQQRLRVWLTGARPRSVEGLLRGAARRLFDELTGDPMHKALVLGKGLSLRPLRAQATEPALWQTELRRRAQPHLAPLALAGEPLALEVTLHPSPRVAGLRHRLFLALVAGIFMTRKVGLLQSAFAASAEVRGNSWWVIFRHARFTAVVRTLWAVVNGRLAPRGEVDPDTAAEIKASLNRNFWYKTFFGNSGWTDTLRAETAALRRESERLGDIGLELAPAAYLRGVLDQQLRETNTAARDRELLLRNLWENPSWTNNLGRLLALNREPENARRELRLRRLERRLLSALLSELQTPGADPAYQLAVVQALAVFSPADQMRLRLALPAVTGTGTTTRVFRVPALVLRTPPLRNPLVSLFPAYDETGELLQPADPNILRTTEGSA